MMFLLRLVTNLEEKLTTDLVFIPSSSCSALLPVLNTQHSVPDASGPVPRTYQRIKVLRTGNRDSLTGSAARHTPIFHALECRSIHRLNGAERMQSSQPAEGSARTGPTISTTLPPPTTPGTTSHMRKHNVSHNAAHTNNTNQQNEMREQ